MTTTTIFDAAAQSWATFNERALQEALESCRLAPTTSELAAAFSKFLGDRESRRHLSYRSADAAVKAWRQCRRAHLGHGTRLAKGAISVFRTVYDTHCQATRISR